MAEGAREGLLTGITPEQANLVSKRAELALFGKLRSRFADAARFSKDPRTLLASGVLLLAAVASCTGDKEAAPSAVDGTLPTPSLPEMQIGDAQATAQPSPEAKEKEAEPVIESPPPKVEQTPGPQTTVSPKAEESIAAASPTPTLTPSPEPKPPPTPTAEPTATPEARRDLAQFTFGEDVPENLRQEIRSGVNIGVSWLAKKSGVNLEGLSVYAYGNADRLIDEYFKRTVVQGNFEQRRAGLRNATAFAGEQKDFFVITTSPGWTRASPIIGGPVVEGRYHTTFHEIYHVLQREVGGYNRPPVGWLNEGGAHYIAARALDENGLYSYEEIKRRHLTRAAFFRDQLSRLEDQSAFANADNYSLSFLAMDLLLGDKPDRGVGALTTYWREIGKGSGSDAAFIIAFGKTRAEYYSEFEVYRARGFQ